MAARTPTETTQDTRCRNLTSDLRHYFANYESFHVSAHDMVSFNLSAVLAFGTKVERMGEETRRCILNQKPLLKVTVWEATRPNSRCLQGLSYGGREGAA